MRHARIWRCKKIEMNEKHAVYRRGGVYRRNPRFVRLMGPIRARSDVMIEQKLESREHSGLSGSGRLALGFRVHVDIAVLVFLCGSVDALRAMGLSAVHEAHTATCSELVDSANSVDGFV